MPCFWDSVKHVIRMKFNVPYEQFQNPFQEERLSREWMAYRLEVFMKYTYPSLVGQTCKAFRAYIYYDVKSEAILKSLLACYPPLEPHIIFTPNMQEAIHTYIADARDVVFTFWDSDNVFHPEFVRRVQQIDIGKHKAIVAPEGAIYDCTRGLVGKYRYPYPDTFYSIVYHTKDYLEGIRYPFPANQYEDFLSGYSCQKLNPYILEGSNFLVLIHGKNISHILEKMQSTGVVTHVSDQPADNQIILKQFLIQE